MYRDRYAMRGDPAEHPKDGPTVFATHSTHKLLAALSQTSFIHIRDGRGAIDHGRFNEAYCSQASTSPLYALIASNDVAAAMMDGPAGTRSRRRPSTKPSPAAWPCARVHQEFAREEGLVLRAVERRESARIRKTARQIPFHEALRRVARDRAGLLGAASRREAGTASTASPDGWCMLDPIKFGIVCPGHAGRRRARQARHPGRHRHGVSRPPRHRAVAHDRLTWCCSCSRSASPRASGARCSTRCSTSRATTTATRRSPRCCPASSRRRRERYAGNGLEGSGRRDVGSICARAGRATGRRRPTRRCPSPKMTPRRAFQRLMAGDAEKVPLDEMANRVVAVGVIPYPARYSDRHAGREHRRRPTGRGSPTCARCRSTATRSPGSPRKSKAPKSTTAAYHVYCVKETHARRVQRKR